jgi:hypothetical protein
MNTDLPKQPLHKNIHRKLEAHSGVLLGNLKTLSFDHQVIFFCQGLVALFCFFPWISLSGSFEMWFHRNVFQGETWLMGIMLLGIAGFNLSIFFDRLAGTKKINLGWKDGSFFLGSSITSTVLVVLIWSVLSEVQGGYDAASIRFGLGGALVANILSLVGAWQLQHTH